MSFVIHFYASTVPNIEILLNRYDASLEEEKKHK